MSDDEFLRREIPTNPAASERPLVPTDIETHAKLLQDATATLQGMLSEVRLYREELVDPEGPVVKLLSDLIDRKLEEQYQRDRHDYKAVRRSLRSMRERVGTLEEAVEEQSDVNEDMERRLKLLESVKSGAATEPAPPDAP